MSREVALSEGAGLSVMDEFIARAIEDPKFDADKLTKLYELRQRDIAVNAKVAFNVAFAAASLEMPTILKRGTISLGKDKDTGRDKGSIPFAKYEDLDRIIKPIERAHGFTRSFRSRPANSGVYIVLVLAHRAGHSEESERQLPPDPGPGRNALQAIGSADSYAKRYLTLGMWNIVTVGADDDGHTGGAGRLITKDQELRLRDLLLSTESDEPRFLKWLKIATGADGLSKIPVAKFDAVESKILEKRR